VLTLTSTETRARALRTAAALGARDQGLTVWEAPQFLSLDRWLAETWAASWPNEQILHPVQELAQWMACVDADPVAEDLLSTKTIARQLRAADRLVASHHIDLSNAPAWTPEQAAFQRWLPQLNAERQSRGELSAAAIPAAFAERLRQGLIRPPEAVALDFPYAGLLLNPSQRAALQALEQTGTRLQHVAPGATVPASSARIFADAEAERRACAAQIAKLLGALSDTATLPVLVVATANPDADRAALEDALQTALRLTPAHGAASAWRFERADALTSNPWAAAALDILSLRLWDNRFSTVSRLLLSGAQWQGPQRAAATRLETQLRERCAPRIHLRDFVTHADPGFRDGWEALEQVVRDEPRRATPGDWVEHFGRRLQALGWGRSDERDSEQWQSTEAVRESLQQLAVLDRQLGAISFEAATGWFGELLRSRRFAPRVDAIQPILICDFEAACETPADARWILGVDDSNVLGRSLNQPFIARELLTQANVPGASPDSRLQRARAMTAAWRQQTNELHLSMPLLDDTGAQQHPSGLLGSDVRWTSATAAFETAHGIPATLIRTPEPALPPITDPAGDGIRGGTRLLQTCAQSLFAAMVQFRLGAEPMNEPANGLDPRAQGQLIHAALAAIWTELGHSQALGRMSASDLEALVDAHLDHLLPAALPTHRYPRLVIESERARIGRLLVAWLQHEQRRSEPFTVLAHERAAEVMFEDLPLRFRVDRLDRVDTAEGSRYLILDYKTGRDVKPGGWQADRLREPQLPLYASPEAIAALGIERADGIAFAHVHANRRRIASATNWAARLIDDDPTPRRQPDFDTLLADTHARLRDLTRAFLVGQADYVPGALRDSPLQVLIRDPLTDDAETDA